MSRNYEQHPEVFPLRRSDYDPDLDGWKADALAELKTTKDAVADYCNLAVEQSEPCDCMQAGGQAREVRSRMTLGTWA